MLASLRLFIGAAVLLVGVLGLTTFVDPELPIRTSLQVSQSPEPVIWLVRKWFEFSNFLQTAGLLDYWTSLLAVSALTLTGIFTVWTTFSKKKVK